MILLSWQEYRLEISQLELFSEPFFSSSYLSNKKHSTDIYEATLLWVLNFFAHNKFEIVENLIKSLLIVPDWLSLW